MRASRPTAVRDRSPGSGHRTAVVVALTSAALGLTVAPPAGAASTSVLRCGSIAVPDTQARAAVSLRGSRLPCATVKRVVRTAYGRSVLIGDTRPFTVKDAGRTYRCRYTPSTGGMVCTGTGRRLRGTI